MTTVVIGESKKAFLRKNRIPGLSNSDIIDSKISTSNLYAKLLPEKDAVVFGNYDIVICYNNAYGHGYEAMTISKPFCESTSFEDTIKEKWISSQDIKVEAKFLSQLECKIGDATSNNSMTFKFVDIQVCGEIGIILFSNDTENLEQEQEQQLTGQEENCVLIETDGSEGEKDLLSEKNNEVLEKATKANNEVKSKIEFWQIEPTEDFYLLGMMDMDLEELKRHAKHRDQKY